MKRRREVRNKDRIGYLRYTGTLAFSSENKPNARPLLGLIKSLAENQSYKGKKDGYYSFTWGQLAPLRETYTNGKVKLSLEFKSARLRFIDLLVEAALAQAEGCTLSLSLKGEMIDFKALRDAAGIEDDGLEGEMGNFDVALTLDGNPVKVAAYPQASMLNIVADLNKESLKPSKLIRTLFKKVCINGGNRRI